MIRNSVTNSFILAGIPVASPSPKHMDTLSYDANIKQWVYRQVEQGTDGKDGVDGVDGVNGADGKDGKSCKCVEPKIVYFSNVKQDLKKGDDLALTPLCGTLEGVSLLESTTVRICAEGRYEITFSAGRNEFDILSHKGSNLLFTLNVGSEDGVDLRCTMLSMAKLIEDNSCTLKIVKVH